MAGKPEREVDPRAEARSRREQQLYLQTRTVIGTVNMKHKLWVSEARGCEHGL